MPLRVVKLETTPNYSYSRMVVIIITLISFIFSHRIIVMITVINTIRYQSKYRTGLFDQKESLIITVF